MRIKYLNTPHESAIDMYKAQFDTARNDDEVEVIYTHLTKIKWENYPNLKHVICPVTSVNHLSPYSTEMDFIYLDNKQHLYNYAWSTAEWTVHAMLSLIRNNKDELNGKYVGFVGYGRVAQQVASILEAFECNLMYYDKYKVPTYNNTIVQNVSLDEIYYEADIISIHLSENPTTYMFFSHDAVDKIRKGDKKPYFINSARSNIVNPAALMFNQKAFRGIALDVIDDYSIECRAELYEISRKSEGKFIITPHVAGQGGKSRSNTDIYVLNKFFNSGRK